MFNKPRPNRLLGDVYIIDSHPIVITITHADATEYKKKKKKSVNKNVSNWRALGIKHPPKWERGLPESLSLRVGFRAHAVCALDPGIVVQIQQKPTL